MRIELNGVQKHILIEHSMDPDKPDNRIIGAALGQAERAPTTLVSNDAALRIKAAHLGLTAITHFPVGRTMETRSMGWGTIDLDVSNGQGNLVDELYATGGIDANAIPEAAGLSTGRLFPWAAPRSDSCPAGSTKNLTRGCRRFTTRSLHLLTNASAKTLDA